MPDTIHKIGIWCAVSSAPQASPDKASLSDQERLGREFADKIGGRVARVYRVPGHSRSIVLFSEAAEQMDAYRALYDDLKAGKLDVLHYTSVDRLGRTTALAQTVLDLCAAHDVIAHEAGTPFTERRNAGQRIIDAVQSVQAAQEIERLQYRRTMGMTKRAKRGLFPGIPPAGYDVIRNAAGETVGAEANEHAEVIQVATRHFLDGLTYAEIARRMHADGYETPTGIAWYPQLINRWVHSDVYAGYVVWGDVRADEPSPYYPALWDDETYQAVLHERESRRTSHRKATSSPYLGIALCNRCGQNMVRVIGGERQPDGSYPYRYLRCSTYHYAHSLRMLAGGDDCHSNGILEDTVRDAAIACIVELESIDDLRAWQSAAPVQEYGEEIERVESRLRAVRLERERLAEALAAGVMDVEVYQAVDGPKREQVLALEARLVELHRKRQQVIAPRVRWGSVEDLRALMAEGWDEAAPNTINALLRRVGLRLYVEEGQIVRAAIV